VTAEELSMDEIVTLGFPAFWDWLVTHPNCILRAGTPEAVLFDDDDLHWHLASAEDGVPVVQVLRGKRLMGELILVPEQITYVQGSAAEQEEEFLFELISETDTERFVAYFFVLVHGYDGGESFTPSRVH
jgi:hypothetical protein